MLKTDRNGVDYTVKHRQVQQSIPVPVRWRDGSHIASRLLTPSENERVFKMLGRKQKVRCCACIYSLSFSLAWLLVIEIDS